MTLPVSSAGRKYGRWSDNPAHPAKKRLMMTAMKAIELPPAASTSQWKGPTRDQGAEGSCTGQMGAAIRDLLYRKLYKFEKDTTVNATDFKTSAAFIYKSNLLADGNLGYDDGSTIHQTFVTLNQLGTCLEGIDPYSDTDFTVPPSTYQLTAAVKYKGGAYHAIADLQTIKSVIASGYSVGFGIDVYESFEGDWHMAGLMPMPDTSKERLLGGHAQHCMDYDDTKQALLIQNSWGSNWGISVPGSSDGGCYWMPYAFVTGGFVTDMWTMHLGKAWQ